MARKADCVQALRARFGQRAQEYIEEAEDMVGTREWYQQFATPQECVQDAEEFFRLEDEEGLDPKNGYKPPIR